MLASRTLLVKTPTERRDYLKIPKWPRMSQRMMKMMTVLKHPPPNFFAPYPAANPRSSLLMILERQVDDFETQTAAEKGRDRAAGADHGHESSRATPSYGTTGSVTWDGSAGVAYTRCVALT